MQYDVYANPSAKSAEAFPYLVDIQSDLLSALATRMVVPLAVRLTAASDIPQRLCPIMVLASNDFVLVPYQTAPLLKTQLKKKVGTVRDHASAIVAAIDAVVSGI
jgi:toxin CcdB